MMVDIWSGGGARVADFSRKPAHGFFRSRRRNRPDTQLHESEDLTPLSGGCVNFLHVFKSQNLRGPFRGTPHQPVITYQRDVSLLLVNLG